jgi:hypothetical protein
LSFKLRIQAASGTGFFSERWNLPSEQFGFVNSYSSGSVSTLTRILSTAVFCLILAIIMYFLFDKNRNLQIVSVALGALIIIAVGYYFSISSNQKSSYIYEKVSVYLAPLVVTVIFVLLNNQTTRGNLNLRKHIIIMLSTITLISGIHFQETYFRNIQTTIIPSALGNIIGDREIQKEFLDTIKGLNREITIIAISHDTEFINDFDYILNIEDRVVSIQSFDTRM